MPAYSRPERMAGLSKFCECRCEVAGSPASRLPIRRNPLQGLAAEALVAALRGHAPGLFHVTRVDREVFAAADDGLRPRLPNRVEGRVLLKQLFQLRFFPI